MIVPEPRNDTGRQRVIAIGCTCGLMLVMYAGLRGTPLPAFGSSRALIRELDPLFLERYAVPPAPTPEPGAPDDDPDRETNNAVESFDRDVGAALEELSRRFETSRAAPDVGVEDAGAARPAIGAVVATEADGANFDRLFGSTEVPVPVAAARTRPAAARVGGGRGIEMVGAPERPAAVAPAADLTADLAVTPEAASGPPRAEAGGATDVVIREFEPETFGRVEADVLTAWMRAHPADLPVGVKVHLNYLPAFLTAAVPLASGNREFELFLMYNQSLRELHIMLVEGDRSVYLIDRGFQEQSRSLREGTVRRLEGDIVAVNSRPGVAGGERAREFYSIFLSWWEGASGRGAR